MSIGATFRKHFETNIPVNNDFSLIDYEEGIMIGIDKSNNVSVVIKSASPKRFPLKHKTKNMSIECNMKVCYNLNGSEIEDVVHIIRCLSDNSKDKELFLELAFVLIADGDGSEEAIMETFSVLRSFFNDQKNISDSELIGLYAELYTICCFHESLHIESYWQSRDRMKFDFSITEKVKLEVKATTKNTRTHHFRHEQLMTELYDIYVLSYLLRYDDEGFSLYDLIIQSKEYLSIDPAKLLRINYVLKNAGEDRLKNMKFNREYTEVNKHFYQAENIPKFNQNTPRGVANAEYDCILDNVIHLEDMDFIQRINAIKEELNV